MTSKFNRTYKGYQPGGTAGGPSTQRICKPVKCDDPNNPTPNPFGKDSCGSGCYGK